MTDSPGPKTVIRTKKMRFEERFTNENMRPFYSLVEVLVMIVCTLLTP